MGMMREDFETEFGTEEDVKGLLDRMGMTMEQIEGMWEADAVMVSLEEKVFSDLGLEPDSQEAENVFREWLMERVNSADFVFDEDRHREMYENAREKGWSVK
jgi:hypothetical protein